MLHTTALAQECYKLMRQIPKGKVTTYKILAVKCKTWPRVIGRICGANPDVPATPCHRVVRSDGKVDGYAFGTDKKIELLKSEGIQVDQRHHIQDFSNKIYTF